MCRYITGCLLLLLLVLIPSTASAQTDSASIIQIVAVDETRFPEMRVQFRVLDGDGQPLKNLTGNDITILEEDHRIDTIRMISGAPVADKSIIVLDLGAYSNFDEFNVSMLKQALKLFVSEELFRNGIDSIALYAVNPQFPATTQQIVSLTTSADEYNRIVEEFVFEQNGGANSLETVEFAYEQLLSEQGINTASIIYIGSLFDDFLGQTNHARGEAVRIGKRLQQSGMRFYGLQTQENQFAEPVQALVEGTGGSYNLFLPNEININIIEQIKQDIEAQNTTYQASYRSFLSIDGTRNVTVATQGDRIKDTESYTVSLATPQVKITSPLDEKVFLRKAEGNGEGTFSYSLNRFSVEARVVEWPDGKPRWITSAELLLDGTVVQTITDPDSDEFQFSVDISEYEENVTLPLILRVRDELGLEATSTTLNVSIEVDKGRPTDTVIKTVVLTPTPGPTPTPIVIIQSDNPCLSDPPDVNACNKQKALFYAPWVGLAVSLLLLVILFTRYRKQMKQVGGRVIKFADNVRKTLLGGVNQTPIAKLYILTAKDDRIGEEYEIFNDLTVLGRDPQLTDLQLYDSDDDSSVSGRHCTIQYEKAQGKFLILDHSAAGTRVNNQKLERDNPLELVDGAEITLGLISKSGAKVRFEIGDIMPAATETMLDMDFQPQVRDTIFDDVGTETQLDFEGDDLGDDTFSPSANDSNTNDNWLDDLE